MENIYRKNRIEKIVDTKDGLHLPTVIFGTSGLGNLFVTLDEQTKCAIVAECVRLSKGPVVFDSAGKYGAGLALESLGKCLRQLNIAPDEVVISNKLGWVQTALTTEEPTFEPGVWRNLTHDAIQKISYKGMLECFEQGNQLLGGYSAQMLSVHDPDEYMATAKDQLHAEQLYDDILEAYRALFELKKQGKATAIGVGAKDWTIIKRIAGDVDLDWIMIANSMTIYQHPQALLDFIAEQERKGVHVINSAVFHAGFLVGGDYFDYKLIDPATPYGKKLLQWREQFFAICRQFGVKPAEASVQYALNIRGVKSIALSTTNPARVKENLALAHVNIPPAFWKTLQENGLVKTV